MRVFVYEYICATGHPGPDSLLAEGEAMLAALLEDFSRISGVTAVMILHQRCALAPACEVWRHSGADEEQLFCRLAAAADCTCVIAPEFDGLLATRCRWVEEAGGRLLGPSAAAAELCADKLALGRHLQGRDVATPPCHLMPANRGAEALPGELGFPVVCKPRHGAGSQATFLARDARHLADGVAQARAEGWHGDLILQPFVPGSPASVAFLLGPRQRLALLPASQDLSQDGRFRYRGGAAPLPAELQERAVSLADRAVAAVPDLAGYVGVDFVLGAAADGSQDVAIEINPRLTTSYVGLRRLAGVNLAEALLRVVVGETVPALTWRPGTLTFRADGRVTWA